ncbi:MAG TPA: chromosomal replication initiator DnaA, partial [Paracoccus solventivorans]|nr:chromosomal replication initiator DnaA [Paracoccus solventivorans]
MPRQLTLDLRTPPALSRQDFLPAPANAEALAMLDRPQDWPQGRLLLVGPEGAGKSHLAAFWAAENGAQRVRASALRPETADALIAPGGALVVEDAHRAGGAAGAETALFHLWNLSAAQGALLLITART